ncbi:hypothetical protein F5884DRAFT_293720 [Xylogone sp. PMI_703]|nr:hypothetical protein F5884DRAFT_293720 [Xylogone sp. PMI_703]
MDGETPLTPAKEPEEPKKSKELDEPKESKETKDPKQPKKKAPSVDDVKKRIESLMQSGKKILEHGFKEGFFLHPPASDSKILANPSFEFGIYAARLAQIQFSIIGKVKRAAGKLTEEEDKKYTEFVNVFGNIIAQQVTQRADAETRRSNHAYFAYAMMRCKTLRQMLFGDWQDLEEIIEEYVGMYGLKEVGEGEKTAGGKKGDEEGAADGGSVGGDKKKRKRRNRKKKTPTKETVEPELQLPEDGEAV